MSDGSNPLVQGVLLFVGIVVVLALIAPSLIPLATNIFDYWIVDHIEGMVAGILVGAFLGSRLEDMDITIFGFSISFGAVAGIIVQYALFH